MKKIFLSIAMLLLFAASAIGCKPEKDNKVEDAIEEAADGIEEAADEVEDAADDMGN